MRHPQAVAPSCLALAVSLALTACSDRPTEPRSPAAPPSERAAGVEGYRGPAERRKGFIFGRTGQPMEITYEVRHGLAVWDGDIVLGRANEIPRTRDALLASRASGPAVGRGRGGVVIDGDSHRWPNGVVPYVVDAGLPNQARATDAMAAIELATNGITFVPRTSEDDYVQFVTSDGCSSAVGRQGGRQDINLADDCSTGNATHEMMHALGMFHEQSRCDRDDFVIIHLENVESGKEHNFDKECDDATDYLSYDVGSMMHYGAFAFSSNGQATIELISGDASQMGQRSALSDTDIQTLNLLYGAFNDAPVASIAPLAASSDEGSAVSFDGSGSSDADDAVLTYAWDFGDGSCAVVPAPAACTSATPTHAYADNGAYTVTLTVSDGYATNATSRTATVLNVAPTVGAGADASLTSGQSYSFSGTFSDPGVVDYPWSYRITWGAGSPTLGSTNSQSQPITASHQFCAAGTYSVVLDVTDKDGGTGSDALTLSVPYVGVSIDITPTQSPNPINPGKKGLVPVAVLSTAAFDASTVDASTVVLGDEAGADTPVARMNNGRLHARLEDVNGDGRLDLVLMFDTQALVANGDLGPATTQLVLRAFLADGCTNVRGADAVVVTP